MNPNAFETCVPGKWVLAGEHTVLNGGNAIALPHSDYALRLKYLTNDKASGLRIFPESAASALHDLLRRIQNQSQLQGKSFNLPAGELHLESTIPIGAGLGSSAALCVAITRWVSDLVGLRPAEFFDFARELENFFHGRSSGMDVAVVSSGEPIAFSMAGGIQRLGVQRLPKFTFHDTGLRARTSDCVTKVQRFREKEPVSATKIDSLMAEASRAVMNGLHQYDQGQTAEGLKCLAQGMTKAQTCFCAWDLVPQGAKTLEEQLVSQGALAVKITGAGGGGFLVALWPGPN